MLRLRRYRLVLVFTAILVLAAYHFSLIGDSESLLSVSNRYPPQSKASDSELSPDEVRPTYEEGQYKTGQNKFPVLDIPGRPEDTISNPKTVEATSEDKKAQEPDAAELLSGVDIKPEKPTKPSKPHWVKLPENYPVPEELIIKLPEPDYTPIPQVQATFAHESDTKKYTREKRRSEVKEAFLHSWEGYKEFAWGHDEVKPISKRVHDPYMGWGATLVDALDTLWIMGLKEEFEEAIEQVGKIDFTTSSDNRIPMFETTIRYLGGLLGAYDVSFRKYDILLEKAIQLADVMYGAFDTPNRMPVLYYFWHPDTVKKPKQAEDSSIAELGSLAMEFTRLAQITGNHSYFDAIQRITNALEEIQMKTSLPGMWPTKLDASGGCKPPPGPIKATGVATEKLRRQIDDGVPENPKPCVPGGIVTRPYGTDQYTLGAMSDSFYEYLIKMHILLGGSTEQYARMHKAALKQIRRLFYRPMAKDDPDILFSGDLEVHGTNKDETFKADSGHLACFTGGMMALGAQALSLPDDLEIGSKLTDGCVWAYGQMKTGLMPENCGLVKCDDPEHCTWDEDKWLAKVRQETGWRPKGASRGTPLSESRDESTRTGSKPKYGKPKTSEYEYKVAVGKRHTVEELESSEKRELGPEEETGAKEYPPNIPPGFTNVRDPVYLLRPEAIESVFIMYRISGDSTWQEKGWKMFEATNKVTRTEHAYAALRNVMGDPKSPETLQQDSMESFWLAETLKYYYLLFSEPDLISLDEYVFNTEAHPFARPSVKRQIR